MLKLENLTVGYEGKPVITMHSLALGERDQCLVTGSSGSGKTSLLYAIAGLMPIMKGRIVVNGLDITRLPEVEMDRFRGVNIGIIFQTLHLMRSLTVTENLLLSSYAVGTPPDLLHIERTLRRLDIYDKRDALPNNLSQGQAQRVGIARAIMHYPKLILADEPTSSLDDRNCETVIALIKEVAEETGAALLIATHDGRVKAHFSNVINFEQR